MENIKKILRNVFLVVLIAFCAGYLIVTGVQDLTNKDDLHTVSLVYGTEFLELEHSINGLIPIGTDYYYLGFDENYNSYIILAPKKWAEKNFSDFNPDAEIDTIIEITGLVKEISDYDVSKEIQSMTAELENMQFPLGTTQCLELSYIKDACMKLFSGILLLILSVTGFIIYKLKIKVPKIVSIIYSIVLLLDLILLIIAIV